MTAKKDSNYSALTQELNEHKESLESASERHSCKTSNPAATSLEQLKHAKALVEKAIKEKKIFTIHGSYPAIRHGLLKRGWVEQTFNKTSKTSQKNRNVCDEGVLLDETKKEEYKSRLVSNETASFIWSTISSSVNYCLLEEYQMTNHFPNTRSFTTKVGLNRDLKNAHWFGDVDPDTFFPRCYKFGNEDTEAFIEDFNLTAAQGILKLVAGWDTKTCSNVNTSRDLNEIIRSVPVSVITTALQACTSHLDILRHKDIDKELALNDAMTSLSWKEFLHFYYQVIHNGAVIEHSELYVAQCTNILKKLKAVNPQTHIDGYRNVWIVKPGALSRCRGIICKDRLEDILNIVDNDLTIAKDKWIVQKYIERPLLVYDTKFDLRQWFLVTDWSPLTIWYYRDSYLRISSQPFILESLDASIHLSSNCIQKNYANSSTRSSKLPADNMWTSNQFQAYLVEIGVGNVWAEIMVPGMKSVIIQTMQCSQESIKSRKNSFELFGADFMFGENFQPWLLEINASPCMERSTAAKTLLCANVQEDILRVVLDCKNNPNGDVGTFELIYKQDAVNVPRYGHINLPVEGLALKTLSPLKLTHPDAAINLVNNQKLKQSLPMVKGAGIKQFKIEVTSGCSSVTRMPKCKKIIPGALNRVKKLDTVYKNETTAYDNVSTDDFIFPSLVKRQNKIKPKVAQNIKLPKCESTTAHNSSCKLKNKTERTLVSTLPQAKRNPCVLNMSQIKKRGTQKKAKKNMTAGNDKGKLEKRSWPLGERV